MQTTTALRQAPKQTLQPTLSVEEKEQGLSDPLASETLTDPLVAAPKQAAAPDPLEAAATGDPSGLVAASKQTVAPPTSAPLRVEAPTEQLEVPPPGWIPVHARAITPDAIVRLHALALAEARTAMGLAQGLPPEAASGRMADATLAEVQAHLLQSVVHTLRMAATVPDKVSSKDLYRQALTSLQQFLVHLPRCAVVVPQTLGMGMPLMGVIVSEQARASR